ncbi:MAG: peroxiredoxin [Ignavibacteriae bacterium]|nr:peroxiredoxin [Ignavibacteria bacterium]MBI3364908.1 peroxiredoxin [Ignavibacteriota bacterium]
MLHVGDRAPDFSALTQAGERIRLSDFHGRKNIVLYFYPKDYTAGCTEQACTLRDNYAELQKLDAVVLGVSADDRYSHSMFAASYNLPFTLLSDPDRTIMREYGSRWLGGLLPVTKRVTYVIDKGGIIGAVIHHEVNMSKHVEDALASLQRLQSR